MPVPSFKTLALLGQPADTTKEIRKLLLVSDKTAGFNPQDITATLDAVNVLMCGHGIEVIRGEWVNQYYQDINLEYVNLGDPYYPTVIFDTLKNAFVIDCWGEYIDRPCNRKRFNQ